MSVDLLEGLNPAQRQAVSAPVGAVLVVAGPGSGKTAVLTRRVAYLIREMGIPPYRIMAVTFTNKAAREMTDRIENLLGEAMKGLSVGTFHAICARILRREAANIGLKPDYVIYDTDDQMALMRKAMEAEKIDADKTSPRRYLSLISGAKNELITADMYPIATAEDRLISKLYKRYQGLLHQANALDFDDLLLWTVLLFRRNRHLLERYRGYYEHILVDEFQDTNSAQYELVKLLAGVPPEPHNSLFCVGDPDQSIYRFRGADYKNVTRFLTDYPDVRQILLEHNYRSHQLILDAAMAIINENTGRIQKDLTSSRKEGPKIILKNLMDENDEAQYVVWTIREYARSGKYRLRDCAVMYRTNAQSRALEETFGRAGIPYRLIGGTRFYGRKEVKDLLAYLRLIHNPDDDISLRRIINLPARGIGAQTLTKLEVWAASRNQSLMAAIRTVDVAPDAPFKGRAAQALIDFGKMVEDWRARKDTTPVGLLVRDVLEQTALTKYYDDGTNEGRDRGQNIMEVYTRAYAAGSRTLADFLEEVALVSDVDNYDDSAESAAMLTLHSAKGLEFQVVFIVGLEEGLLPHAQSITDDEQLAEERRLMYVGVTRAKQLLHLTWATRRSFYGNMGERAVASRFLEKLPRHAIIGDPVPRRDTTGEYRERAAMTTWHPPKPPTAASLVGQRGIPSTPRPPVRASSLYKAGQRVRHDRFGDGTIIASKIRGEEEEIDVKFDKFGIKRLSTSIAPLTLIEDED